MSEFSDFQQSECEQIVLVDYKQKDLCQSCVPNPNYSLQKPWYDMTEGWLDEKECRYKIRVSKNKLEKYLRSLTSGPLTIGNEISDQDVIRYGIRRLLVQYSKMEADETVCAFGGCAPSPGAIADFRNDIYLYKQKLARFDENQSFEGLTTTGAFAGTLLGTLGLLGGWTIFGAAALTGLIKGGER